MNLVVTRVPSVSQALNDVNKAARDDVNGTGQAHLNLREAIQKLTLAVEKPAETLMRTRFEVCCLTSPSLPRTSGHLLT